MINQFINEKLINPMCNYYTFEGTVIYALILVIAVFLVYRLLKYLNVRIDERFFVAIIPYIMIGGVIRALRDHDIFYITKYWCSPGIYFMIFGLTLVILLYSIGMERSLRNTVHANSFKYHKIMFIIGIILLFFNLSMVEISNWDGFFIIFALALTWTALFSWSL